MSLILALNWNLSVLDEPPDSPEMFFYLGILFGVKKLGRNMYECWGYYAKCNKPVTKRHIKSDSSYMRYLEQANS